MSGATALLFIAALVLRAAAAGVRATTLQWPYQVGGWLLCTVASWLVASAAGAWAPLWPALALGLIGAFFDVWFYRPAVRIGIDTTVVALAGWFSLPSLSMERLAMLAIGTSGSGFLLDLLVSRLPKRMQAATVLSPLLAGLVVGALWPHFIAKPIRESGKLLVRVGPTLALHIGVTPVHKGDRIILRTGAVAWLDRPSGPGPFLGALLFHGARSDGSQQPAAYILRRALLNAGLVVLAVDHPGFGESPAPSPVADLAAWDPLPTELSALETLRATPGVEGILAIGHSMGVGDVLSLLHTTPQLLGAVLFGGGLNGLSERDPYWYTRFHTDRRMRERLSLERFHEIGDRFYNQGKKAETLPLDHAPILFVRFGLEYPNIVASRDLLYERIPGRKTIWDLVKSTHYFNSFGSAGLVIGDTRTISQLASRLHTELLTRFEDHHKLHLTQSVITP
jgi:pimeloyl-ACP methyl ester carboxylesterase